VSAHSSSDDPTRYRDERITDQWRKKDPIARFRAWLINQGVLDAAADDKLRADLEAEVREIIAAQEKVTPPPLSSLVDDVFAEVPPHLQEQLQELTALPRQKLGGVHQ
jgi:TPP-dependent pyruvate/acetoin dehydrogenase alpha subunit